MKNKDLLVLFLNHLDKMDLLPFNRLYNYDSFSQEFLDSNEAKINYTHSCTELKSKEKRLIPKVKSLDRLNLNDEVR